MKVSLILKQTMTLRMIIRLIRYKYYCHYYNFLYYYYHQCEYDRQHHVHYHFDYKDNASGRKSVSDHSEYIINNPTANYDINNDNSMDNIIVNIMIKSRISHYIFTMLL